MCSIPGRGYGVVWNIAVVSTELMVVLNNAPGSYANANYSSTTLGALQQQCITNLSCYTCQQVTCDSLQISVMYNSMIYKAHLITVAKLRMNE